MSFAYLHILLDGRNGIVAKVTKSGVMSLGSENSRFSHNTPIGVFQLDHFEGLECISDSDIMNEARRRFSRQDLVRNLTGDMTFDELIDALKRHVGYIK